MRAASISMILGLTLMSGALLAETAGLSDARRTTVQAEFRAHDADGDGRITRAEARHRNAGLHTHFSKFDRDADGALSLEEFRRHAAPAAAGG
jgi:Ca2+-binding EF-hand superfamily protein